MNSKANGVCFTVLLLIVVHAVSLLFFTILSLQCFALMYLCAVANYFNNCKENNERLLMVVFQNG